MYITQFHFNLQANESRFVQTPTKEVISRLESEDKELKGDVVNLEKKLHYLETTYKNSRDGIERLLKSAGV